MFVFYLIIIKHLRYIQVRSIIAIWCTLSARWILIINVKSLHVKNDGNAAE